MTRRMIDPLSVGADAAWRADIERRLDAIAQKPQLLPPISHPGRPVQALSIGDGYQNVTSATFVTNWDTIMDRIVHAGMYVAVPWQTEAGTTGELRLNVWGYTTSAVALPAASSGTQTFRFRHGITPWTSTYVSAAIESRRTGGGGNVRIGVASTGFVQVDPRDCTLTGI